MCRTRESTVRWIFLIVFIVTLLIGTICLLAGWYTHRNHNNDQIPAQCLCVSHTITATKCSYSCNCHSYTYSCGSPNHFCSSTQCDTCYKDCYDGLVTLTILDIVSDVLIFIVNSDSLSALENELNKDYPINGTVPCYYDDNNPKTISFALADENGPFIAAMVFFALAGVTLLLWCTIELLALVLQCRALIRVKEREGRARAPVCVQCKTVRLENQGTVFFPRYNSDQLCDRCAETNSQLSEFLGDQDSQFKNTFTKTVIEMASKQ